MRSMVEGYAQVITTWPASLGSLAGTPPPSLRDGPPPRFGEDYNHPILLNRIHSPPQIVMITPQTAG